jgi:hypothetical protein
MSYNHVNITVATTPTVLVTIPEGNPYTAVTIQNNHSAALFLGDNTVTATTSGATSGFSLVAAGAVTVWLHSGSVLYGIVATSATATGVVKAIYSTVV